MRWCLLIMMLGAVVRLWGLSNLPVGFTPDEASFGYDAWSILTTGKDQWGNVPWVLKSFGDYKAPLYAFLCLPFVAVIGLSEVAVRLPNALLSLVGVAVVYKLALELTGDRRVGLLAALSLAISPWEVMLSRGGFEANLGVLFLSLTIWGLARARRDGRWWGVVAAGVTMGMLSYHAARLVTLPILVVFFWWWRKELFTGKGILKWKGAMVFLVGILLVLGQQWGGSGARVGDVSILSPDDGWRWVSDRRFEWVKKGAPDGVARFFVNKVTDVLKTGVRNYWSYFSFEFLFTEGPGEGTYGMIPGVGLLYPAEAIFLIVFLYFTVRERRASGLALVAWLLLAAIPAALSKGPGGAANRAAIMMPAWQIASGWGAVGMWELVRKRKWGKWLAGILVAWTGWVAIAYAGTYIYESSFRVGENMLFGRREVMEYVGGVAENYEKVVVSRKLSEPQIYTAFYLRVLPNEFQRASKEWMMEDEGVKFLDQLSVYRLGRYEFRSINWESDKRLARVLLVGVAEEIPAGSRILKEVKYENGKVAIRVVESEGERLAER